MKRKIMGKLMEIETKYDGGKHIVGMTFGIAVVAAVGEIIDMHSMKRIKCLFFAVH
jgi:predicted RNase H-like nuclease (RuvC/YqgF family)